MSEKYESEGDLVASAAMVTRPELEHVVKIGHRYEIECYGPDGKLKWADGFDNLVTTAGRNKYLDATLKTGLASPSWFVGLVTGPGGSNTYAAGDTMASHAGWAENTAYSEGTRQALTLGAIASGSVDNSAARATFSINASATIGGAFTADNSTKGGTTGTLLGVGSFGADKIVSNGDTVLVAITASIT